jgi:2-dehydropantoate 2-reductase
MRICVYGAGAIGGHIASRLVRGGAEVSIVARGAHLAAIRDNGLTVHGHDGTHHSRPAASDDPREIGPQDAVIVTVKGPALPSVAAGIAPLLGPDTPVAFVMNGIPWWYFDQHGGPHDGLRLPEADPGEALRSAIGTARTIGGVVYTAAEVVAPGVVHSEHGNIRVILGELDGRISDRASAIAAVMEAGGLPSPVSPDIRREVWMKLLGNLAGGPALRADAARACATRSPTPSSAPPPSAAPRKAAPSPRRSGASCRSSNRSACRTRRWRTSPPSCRTSSSAGRWRLTACSRYR